MNDDEVKVKEVLDKLNRHPPDPSPTPWDFSTWGYYCKDCVKFIDVYSECGMGIGDSGLRVVHKHCGKEATYIGFDRNVRR